MHWDQTTKTQKHQSQYHQVIQPIHHNAIILTTPQVSARIHTAIKTLVQRFFTTHLMCELLYGRQDTAQKRHKHVYWILQDIGDTQHHLKIRKWYLQWFPETTLYITVTSHFWYPLPWDSFQWPRRTCSECPNKIAVNPGGRLSEFWS